MSIQNRHEAAYMSILRGVSELDFSAHRIPSVLLLTGENAFPLAMNSQDQVLMAASSYGQGRIIVFGHEGYLIAFPALVENALTWLRGDRSDRLSINVHSNISSVAYNLSRSSFQGEVDVVEGFKNKPGVGVYVTDAYNVGADSVNLVAFIKAGGGVLIAGHALSWAEDHPKENILHKFEGNRVSGVAGIFVSDQPGVLENLLVYPHIPTSLMAPVIENQIEDDLKFLLQGISRFDIQGGTVLSEILVHGPLAFPVGTTSDGQPFLAASYYGLGRVIVVSHEGLLGNEAFTSFWKNALQWLDAGHSGIVGVEPDNTLKVMSKSGLQCQRTSFKQGLSVFVGLAYNSSSMQEIQNFVAEGGGLLLGGHVWYWAIMHPSQNVMTNNTANKMLNKMGLSMTGDRFSEGTYIAVVPSEAKKRNSHFHYLLRRFAKHIIAGEKFNDHSRLRKLGTDCLTFLGMKASESCSYNQVMSTLVEILKITGLPQASESNPIKTAIDHFLVLVGPELYKIYPRPNELLPFLARYNPMLPVVNNKKIKISADTGGSEEWLSTGLYLFPGMNSHITVPAGMVNMRWQIQIGCQTDYLSADVVKRPPRAHVRYPINSQKVLVWNLWGGLIYFVAPPSTNVKDMEIEVELATLVPYYKSGVTSLDGWSNIRRAIAPWAELEFDNIIITVPSKDVWNLGRPDELATHWNAIMKAIAELAVIPLKFRRKERFVIDVQISYGWMHAGYPCMGQTGGEIELVSRKHAYYHTMWGAIHELGHNQQRSCWEFPPHTTECTNNLWALYVHEKVMGYSISRTHPNMTYTNRQIRINEYIKKGRKLDNWHMWIALETYVQLKEKFGWDAFKKVFGAYHTLPSCPGDNRGKMNLFVVMFSRSVKWNLCGFFKAWGWPINKETEENLSSLHPWANHQMVKYG